MGLDIDPVGAGLVASLGRPGGNVTGVSGLSPELSGKQLQILKELVPKFSRVAVIGDSATAGTAQSLSALQNAAGLLKVHVQFLNIRNVEDIRAAFRDAIKAHADAMIVFASGTATNNRQEVTRLAASNRLPAIYYVGEFVDAGALITYGVRASTMFRRAAVYVDKILKGTKPAELPIEQPAVFDLVINMKTAKALGLKVPQSIVLQATKIIE
jgi:putative ABC transport system substrate-binding protein